MKPDSWGGGGGEVVTILFTDVQGSTELGTRIGDDAARDVLRAHDELVREQIVAHDGREIKAMGDGFMVAFKSPRRAVACAAAIHAAIDLYVRADPARELSVRIGVHTGEAHAEDGDLFGTAVNAAARVAGAAKGGETLVTDVVRQLAGSVDGVRFTDCGGVRLKGFESPWQLFQAVAEAGRRLTVGPLERTPFVGRAEQKGALRELLDRALAGNGSMVMIGGEPGVGKTRLTEELCGEASKRQMRIRVGRCKDMEGTPPFLPFVEILEAALADAASLDQFRAALGDDAGEVARVMPKLRRVFSDIPAPLELPPQQERQYLLNSFRDYVVRAATARPIVAILEDLQWADESSLALLEHLAPTVAQIALVVLCTYRDVEVDASRPLARTLETLIGQRLAHRMALKRLPQEAVVTMLRALAGQEPPAALSKVVFDETEGNPFFVEEVFRHLLDDGKLFDSQGRFRSDLKIADYDVPESVRLAIGNRLHRLAEPTRWVLTTAAVMGRDFSFHVLQNVGEVKGEALLGAIEEAERARLILPAAGGGDLRYTFAHELIRQTLLSDVSPPRRINLHLLLAETLERLYAETLDSHAAEIANHLHQAGPAAEQERTARFHLLAGRTALTAGACEDSLRHFERAESAGVMDDRARADLYQQMGLAQRSLARSGDAQASWEKALGAYELLGDARAVGELHWQVTRQLVDMIRLPEAADFGRRGLSVTSGDRNIDRCKLLAATAMATAGAGDHVAAEELIGEARTMADQLGVAEASAYCGHAEAFHHCMFMRLSEALIAGQTAAAELRRVGNMWDLASTLAIVSNSLYAMARTEEAGNLTAEAEALAMRLGSITATSLLNRNRSPLGMKSAGDLDAFRDNISAQIERYTAAGSAAVSAAWMRLGLVRFWQGDWEQALDPLRESDEHEPPVAVAGWGAFFPMCLAYSGDHQRALIWLERRRGEFAQSGRSNTQTAWSLMLTAVETLAVAGQREIAAALYPVVLEAIDCGAVGRFYDFRLLETIAGIAAASGAQWGAAETHFKKAVAVADGLPHPIEQADARRFYARMLLDRGQVRDRALARNLLQEALSLYTKMGMRRHRAMAEEMLTEASSSSVGSKGGKEANTDGLTAREVEILQLLAAGRTSSEMAEQLSLSVATVQRHVANIYGKIGARNRAEATSYALRRGLGDPDHAAAST